VPELRLPDRRERHQLGNHGDDRAEHAVTA
jgi:hypothetical protein